MRRDATDTSFVAVPGERPVFGQSFPAINFNPPGGIINHNVSGVSWLPELMIDG